MSGDIQQQSGDSDEKQLCTGCLAPNEPSANFCVKCGAPLSSYAFTGPFESIFAEGSSYRQAAERPRSLVVVLGVWLIFGMMALGGIIATIAVIVAGGTSDYFVFILSIPLAVLSLVMLWKTTRNYLTWKRTDQRRNRTEHSTKPPPRISG